MNIRIDPSAEDDSPGIREYLAAIPAERLQQFSQLRITIRANLPPGFEEEMSYGMLGYVVPKRLYPAGYHCDPEKPLPFINIASQKKYISLYHMGLYAIDDLMRWFIAEYPKHCVHKLDMGKSCVRFQHFDDIPYDLIGELASKINVDKWIALYESSVRK